MNNHSRYITSVLFIVLVSILSLSCKENSVISTKVLPNSDSAKITAVALDVYAATVYDGDVNTGLNNGQPIYHALGTYNDPVFGKTNAGIYFQVIPTAGIDLSIQSDSIVIDSAVLILPYSGFTYGNTTDQSLTQTYSVYRVLTDSFPVNTSYAPNQAIPIDMVHPLELSTIVNINSTFNLADSISVNGINEPAHLRIRLNNNFLKIAANTSSSSFISSFNGFYIQSSDTNQAITALPYFRLDGVDAYSQANVQVYYHIKNDTEMTTSYYFTPTACGHGNKMSRIYPSNFINTYFSSPSQINNTVALQGPPGAAIDITIPLQKNNIPLLPTSIVNKAELSITCTGFDALCPPNLSVTGIDSNDNYYIIDDLYPTYSTSPLAVFDGTPHNPTGTATGTTYIVNIPREIMKAVKSNKVSLHLRINGYNGLFNYPGAYRMIGSNIKLNIVYSTLK